MASEALDFCIEQYSPGGATNESFHIIFGARLLLLPKKVPQKRSKKDMSEILKASGWDVLVRRLGIILVC